MRSPKVTTWAGVDVGGKELKVALVRGGEEHLLTIDNTPEGHKVLVRALKKKGGLVRVVLEATGSFHLDLALVLAKTTGVQLMVVNPLAARRFAQAQMTRAKTDKVDARMLLTFCQRMPFEPWCPPSHEHLALRAVGRHIATLVAEQTAVKNRLSAARATDTTPAFVIADLEDQLVAMEARIEKGQEEALRLVQASTTLQQEFDALDSLPGVGPRSATLLLAELGVLDRAMSPDQVVGHAGLDPRPKQSGTRGNRDTARSISKVGNARLRGTLYMVALTASRDGAVGAFYTRLNATKPPFVAHVAVMRRLLRVAWVVLVRNTMWDETLFLPRSPKVTNQSLSTHENVAEAP
jgi:transposase